MKPQLSGMAMLESAVLYLSSIILVSAALIKLFLPSHSPAIDAPWHSVLNIALVQAEICAAAICATRGFGSYTSLFAASLFATFSVANVFKIALGAESCGCFGSLEIPPYIMAWANAVVAIAASSTYALFKQRPESEQQPSGASRYAAALLLVSPVVLLASEPEGTAGQIGFPRADLPRVDLASLISGGEPVRGLSFLMSTEELEHGSWHVAFIRPGCGKCAELIDDLQDVRSHGTSSLCIVELPSGVASIKNAGLLPPARRSGCHWRESLAVLK